MSTLKKSGLDNIRVAAPCDMPWEDMAGDERSRYCAKCELNVFNISEMTRDEAETFLREKAGKRVCGRIYRRKDGTVITKNCPSGVAKIRRKRFFAAAAIAVLFGGINSAFAAKDPHVARANWFGDKMDHLSHRFGLNFCNCPEIMIGEIMIDEMGLLEPAPELLDPAPETGEIEDPEA